MKVFTTPPSDLGYDGNFNLMWTGGFSAGYDSENHLTAIGSGEDYGQFTYDGLGRCLKISTGNSPNIRS